MNGPWGTVSCAVGERHTARIGAVEVSLARHEIGWRVATRTATVGDRAPGDEGAVRHVRSKSIAALYLTPALPNLPLLVKPDEPVHVVPGATVSSRLMCPVFIRVAHVPTERNKPLPGAIVDLPSQPMKRTWFGTGSMGESAYQHELHAEGGDAPSSEFVAIELSIRNSSSDVLLFERLLARVIYLNVFVQDGCLFGSPIRVRFRGRDQISQVTFGSDGEVEQGGAVFIGGRREPPSNDLIRKSFLWLKDLAG